MCICRCKLVDSRHMDTCTTLKTTSLGVFCQVLVYSIQAKLLPRVQLFRMEYIYTLFSITFPILKVVQGYYNLFTKLFATLLQHSSNIVTILSPYCEKLGFETEVTCYNLVTRLEFNSLYGSKESYIMQF